jgi:hypothetical protein
MNSRQDIRKDPITKELPRQLKHDTVAFPPSGEKAGVIGGEVDTDAPPATSEESDVNEGDENDASVFPPSGSKGGGGE